MWPNFRCYHSIDLGDEIITPGTLSVQSVKLKSDAVFDPVDLGGRSVMDLGACNSGGILSRHIDAERAVSSPSTNGTGCIRYSEVDQSLTS